MPCHAVAQSCREGRIELAVPAAEHTDQPRMDERVDADRIESVVFDVLEHQPEGFSHRRKGAVRPPGQVVWRQVERVTSLVPEKGTCARYGKDHAPAGRDRLDEAAHELFGVLGVFEHLECARHGVRARRAACMIMQVVRYQSQATSSGLLNRDLVELEACVAGAAQGRAEGPGSCANLQNAVFGSDQAARVSEFGLVFLVIILERLNPGVEVGGARQRR